MPPLGVAEKEIEYPTSAVVALADADTVGSEFTVSIMVFEFTVYPDPSVMAT